MSQENIPRYFSEFLKEFTIMRTDLKVLKTSFERFEEDFKKFKIEVNERFDIHFEAIGELKVKVTAIEQDIVKIKEDIVNIKADIYDIKVELKKKVDKEDIKDLRVYIGQQNKVYSPVFA